ncbi:MAG: ATP-binding protein [Candidatus Omnitrophica bacterium]|jgi:MinD superfamily P-loop ATPase|nr:ATP-binding protein [Candidatus Omnitrophota bacterium]
MKQIVVISGKGGTGKTILSASFAALARNKVMVDCDVDAADLHLLLHPKIKERNEFKSGKTARIDRALCKECGKCIKACRFNAINQNFAVDSISCEGCGLCVYICPANAVAMEENLSGEWFISESKYGPFVHAKLGIASENSGKLVSKIRQVAKEIADREKTDYIIIDGPPGIGCPVIASLSGVDLAVIVTEPTVSGIHDMTRVLEVAAHFDIKTGVVINKYDLNLQNSKLIEEFCKVKNINIIGQIPFSLEVNRSIVKTVPAVEFCSGIIREKITAIWETVVNNVG